MPEVTVILTSYNNAKYLREAIDSVLNQTYDDFELIIWDDASTDDSLSIALSSKDARVRVYKNEEKMYRGFGINKVISQIAKGEYIAVLHSDDIWDLNKLEVQVRFLNENQDIGAVFTDVLAIREDGFALKDTKNYYSIFKQPNRSRHEWLNHFFYKGNELCHSSVLIRRQCYIDCGLYQPWLVQTDDFEMWVRLCLKYEIYVMPEKLVHFRVRDNEAYLSGNHPVARTREENEFYFIIKSYSLLETYEDMVSVFPVAQKYFKAEGFDKDFVLAMICLEYDSPKWAKPLGLKILFELVADLEKYNKIKCLYNFTYHSWLELTAIYNSYSFEALSNFYHTVESLFFEKEYLGKGPVQKKEQEKALIENELQKFKKELVASKLYQAIGNITNQLFVLTQENTQKNLEIRLLNDQLRLINQDLNLMRNSISWRITAPLRSVITFFKSFMKPSTILVENNIDESNELIIQTDSFNRLSIVLFFLKQGIRYPWITIKLLRPQRIINALIFMTKDRGNTSQILKKYEEYYGESVFNKFNEEAKVFLKIAKLEKCLNTIFIFPVIDWNFRHQRPQHFALGLGKLGYRVIYFSTLPLIHDEFNFSIIDNPGKNVYVCKISNNSKQVDNIYRKPMPVQIRNGYQKSVLNLMEQLNIKSSISIINHPYWKPLVDFIPGTIIGYDCMDHHIGFHKDVDEIPEHEINLIRNADFVVTSSLKLHERISEYRQNIIIRNGCESSCFLNQIETFPKDNRPVAGYIGAISDWFDIDLIAYAAERLRNWRFILVGSSFGCDIGVASKLSNVEFIGEVEYSKVPYYISGFDVCLIPFLINELTKSTNPVKVYEYLCAGKPVVSTAIPEVVLLKDKVFIGNNQEEYTNQILNAYSQKDKPELIEERQSWAVEQDWSLRVEHFEEIMNLQPLISIVVLTYNNMVFTKECLESIELFTYYPNHEVIIVDNASTDGSQEYLKGKVKNRANWRLIINNRNLGFAAGNNVGIEAAQGEFIVLLNNDTYVTPGWLKSLARPFIANNNLGLTGPVTNNIGNEARINTNYKNMEEMILQARSYTNKNNRKLLFTNNIAFFCVAIKRDVIEKVGLLDEQFEIGFFEDDDYCRRAADQGYTIAIVEDCFVHHHLNAAFDKMNNAERKRIFEANKIKYESKWGPWQPHSYR